MHYIVKIIMTLLISAVMQSSAINLVSVTPAEATEDFLDSLKTQESKTMNKYMDNTYVNFLVNAEGDDEVIERMNEALFKNFQYDIQEVKKKNDVAVAKVLVKSNDFSNVLNEYSRISYDYVMDNLYEDSIADKAALEEQCLEIYVSEIEKAAESENVVESIAFIPMIDDGYYGWNIIMSDQLMKSVLGNLAMPTEQP
ncbi:MAG: hypothetical protein UIJ87_06530 [Anaerovoracaceae bacterium]|nr:hypothetical protein [Anaerovoracaceae bacterium]